MVLCTRQQFNVDLMKLYFDEMTNDEILEGGVMLQPMCGCWVLTSPFGKKNLKKIKMRIWV